MAGFGSDLQAVETISLVQGQLDSEVTAFRVIEDEVRVSVRLVNPTGYPVRLRGTFVRVVAEDGSQLAYGAGQRVDEGGEVVEAKGELIAHYVVRLSPEQVDRLRAAVAAGPVRVRLSHSLSLQDESFTLARTDERVSGEVDS